jgi:hypothetical protein
VIAIDIYSHVSPERIDHVIDILDRIFVENDVENRRA